jgi:3-deoxy-D-manno-octulosonate 8-phosphate phosphatase KdsC-like HAD superfamily phosphatase
MKENDIRLLRKRAKDLGIKYISSYTKRELMAKIQRLEDQQALAELDALMSGKSVKDLIAPVIINVKVPRNKPYKLHITHE